MSQVTLFFCAIIFIFSSCKSRDDAQLTSENNAAEVFTLKGHRIFRFNCSANETPPNCKDWDFQELDDFLASHPDNAAYQIVAPALRDIASASKDIANVKAAMANEITANRRRAMQARIDFQDKEIKRLQRIVVRYPNGQGLYDAVEALRGNFLDDFWGNKDFRGQDWSKWLSAGLGMTTCALTTDGKPLCWGDNREEQSDGHQKKVKVWMQPMKMIRPGSSHSCALTNKSEPVCWGSDAVDESDGHLKKLSQEMFPLKSITVGFSSTCALTKAGPPICWGSVDIPVRRQVATVDAPTFPLKALSSGAAHTCAISAKGELVCWGRSRDEERQVDGYTKLVKPEMVPFSAISAGNFHTCALTKQGSPICWGGNYADLCRGHEKVVTPDMLPLRAISAGQTHTCALTKQGRPICWGANDNHQNDGYQDILKPEMLPLKTISVGAFHTCALTALGRAICWGSTSDGATTGRSPEGYKLGLNVPEDVDLSFEAFWNE